MWPEKEQKSLQTGLYSNKSQRILYIGMLTTVQDIKYIEDALLSTSVDRQIILVAIYLSYRRRMSSSMRAEKNSSVCPIFHSCYIIFENAKTKARNPTKSFNIRVYRSISIIYCISRISAI